VRRGYLALTMMAMNEKDAKDVSKVVCCLQVRRVRRDKIDGTVTDRICMS
jgi:hypothetical protein